MTRLDRLRSHLDGQGTPGFHGVTDSEARATDRAAG
jgi:hypothetical protein